MDPFTSHSPSSSQWLEGLNEDQKRAVAHPKGPVLVLAGAGSGKTRVVTRRIAHLLSSGVLPQEIIALTFTNKAAGEMKERLHSMVAICPWMGTFHSFGLRILREWSPLLGLEAGFAIYDPDDCEKLMRSVLQAAGLKLSPSLVIGTIGLCKNLAKGPQEVQELPPEASEELEFESFVGFYDRYEASKRACNAVDFDDLLFLCVKLFKEHPSVLQELQARWRYLLVDEYQDTNFCQYEFIRLLAGTDPDLFVVGDPDQSIYSWRGADIQNILNFERDFPGATLIFLEENYRSSPEILHAASALIANNQQRYEKCLRSTQKPGEPLSLQCAIDDRAESAYVASEIERLLDQGKDPHEIAIFYRTNFQSRSVEDALRRLGIGYRISGGVSFYQRKEIKDMLSYLRLAVYDFDRLAFERALSVPKRGLGEKTLQKLFLYIGQSQKLPLEVMRDKQHLQLAGMAPKAIHSLMEFGELIHQLQQDLSQEPIHECLARVLEKSGYLKFLQEQEDQPQERLENLNELIGKAMEWESQASLDKEILMENASGSGLLRAFLEEMNLGPQEMFQDKEASAVAMMTVHHAKGLEFDFVFVVGLEEMLFPHVNQREDEMKIEEERRLLYVAMTRARKKLYLCCSGSRFLWGSVRTMRPSRFIQELPLDVMMARGFSRNSWFF